jgi:hypothetical protein
MSQTTHERLRLEIILNAIKTGLEHAKARGDEDLVKNLQAATGLFQALTKTPPEQLKALLKMAEIVFEDERRRYEKGEKHTLLRTILHCRVLEMPLPEWVDRQLDIAAHLFQTGQLKSWDEIFGKPFPGKSRAGLLTRSRAFEICREADRLKRQHNFTESRGLFEQVAENLKIGYNSKNGWTGWATVRDIYFKEKAIDRDLRRLHAALQNSQ